jgi:hypothetical protein
MIDPRRRLRRRMAALAGALGVGLLAVCGVRQLGGRFVGAPDELPQALSPRARALVEESLAEIPGGRVVDYHVHVLGTGSSGAGLYVSSAMRDPMHPIQRFKLGVYLDAAGIDDESQSDTAYRDRLFALIAGMGRPGRFYLMAFDQHYRPDGTVDPAHTTFHVPNEWVFELTRASPEVLVPVMSVHPYRGDALAELERWAHAGGRMLKWLPNAMGIDPADARLDPFYDRMAALGVVLLSHAGDEQAVEAVEAQRLGNPLRLRRPLDRGVTVIVAHCASSGQAEDLDDPGHAEVPAFDLFLRLMDEPRYRGRVFGDLSGLAQVNRLGAPLQTLLGRADLYPYLVNASDYPLPAINGLTSTWLLWWHDYLSAEERDALNEVYAYNPLLFDLLLKRLVKDPETGQRFAASVFAPNPLLP